MEVQDVVEVEDEAIVNSDEAELETTHSASLCCVKGM